MVMAMASDPSSDLRALGRADAALIFGACRLLRLPEFRFFQLAHERWFGRRAEDRELEPAFVRFLYGAPAPLWVRHLAREVMGRARFEPIGPETYGVEPILPPPIPDHRQRLADLFLALVYGVCFVTVTLIAL
jgi:hypothetical protein